MNNTDKTKKAVPAPETQRPTHEEQDALERALAAFSAGKTSVRGHVDDIRLMLAYCRNAGIAVSAAVREYLAPSAAAPKTQDEMAAQDLEKVLKLHEQLAARIVPATPRSLAATDFWGRRSVSDSRTVFTLLLFLFLLAMAALGLYGFIDVSRKLAMSVVTPKQSPEASPEPTNLQKAVLRTVAVTGPSDPNTPMSANAAEQAGNMQQGYLWAAVLGAALSGLFTMQRYIRARTFEPDYVFVYLIRFTIGVVAGVVLANLGKGLFEGTGTISKLGPGGIAFLGGYSAEGVRQILDRLVQVLVATVKGQDLAAGKLAVAREMLSIADKKTGEAGTPEAIKTAVTELIKNPEK